jgi:hypothetical protein
MQSHDEVYSPQLLPPTESVLRPLEASLGRVFEADWHPHLREKLAVFPRYVQIHTLTPEGAKELLHCWPDFATFLEDAQARQIAYYPMEPGVCWVRVAHDEGTGALHTFLYCDGEAVACG